ncbi:MAG: DUF2156 domain-containing protein, partial [Bdellovibrionales bacterium]|nr:DUF2156 domain-containing protein [Bdellovibrionales bacterium]
ALLMKALSTLFEEGACEISLGEVPFAHPNEEIESVPQPMFLTMLHPILKKVISRRIRLKTLQAFKQKFLPEWRPVYVYSSRRLLLHDLTHLAFLTNSLPFIHQEKDAIQSFKAFKLRAPTLCPTSSSLYSTGIPFSWRS